MNLEKSKDYQLIAKAIEYLEQNTNKGITMQELAAGIHLTNNHFQELFKRWAGISASSFMEGIQLAKAFPTNKKQKETLFENQSNESISENINAKIHIEEMSVLELKDNINPLLIDYNFYESRFGNLLLANTKKGICYAAFYDDGEEDEAVLNLKKQYQNALFQIKLAEIQKNAMLFFEEQWDKAKPLQLHVPSTQFLLEVWQVLLTIPMGSVSTYGELAAKIGKPKAARAVGNAISKNLVAFLIPCHRVIQKSGKLGGFRWGNTRKKIMLGWEFSKENQ